MTAGTDRWFVEYVKVTAKRLGKTWVANYNLWVTLSKYKVHGNYGPLYEIVTAGHEIESEVGFFIHMNLLMWIFILLFLMS